MEVGLAIWLCTLFSWLQANLPEQHFSSLPSLLVLKIWNQCVLWVVRAVHLLPTGTAQGVSTLAFWSSLSQHLAMPTNGGILFLVSWRVVNKHMVLAAVPGCGQ